MLPSGFPLQSGNARNAAILAAIQAGQATWSWTEITYGLGGHAAQFMVMTDGLKIGGVRVVGSASFCQTIADLLGACLQTVRLNDLAWLQAAVRIPPQTMYPNGTDTASMVRESALIDAAVAGRPGLVAPIGKPWVISKKMSVARATLYGWQSAAPIPGVPLEPSPATPGVKVIQGLSTAHYPGYDDYSSLVNLVSRQCVIDGVLRDLRDVLQDPYLATLASHEGVIPVRQAGVPEMVPVPSLAPALWVSSSPQTTG